MVIPKGTQTTVSTAVVVLIRDAAGHVLLTSSSATANGPWSHIGGGVSQGENPVSAAKRIAHDECGLEIEVGRLLTYLAGPAYQVLYECGADTTYEASVFSASILGFSSDAPMSTKCFDLGELAVANLDEFASASIADLGLV